MIQNEHFNDDLKQDLRHSNDHPKYVVQKPETKQKICGLPSITKVYG